MLDVADSIYASLRHLERCRSLSDPIAFIDRLRLDASLYEPATARYPGQRIGRLRLKGNRLPILSVVAEDSDTDWTPMTLAHYWYGEGERAVEVVSETAVWYSTGLPAVPLRWVLIRDPKEELNTQALLCTDLDAKPERIISWFVRRWQMEATFQEVRQRLGFETQRHWSELWPSGEPRRSFWARSRWSPSSPIGTWPRARTASFEERPGTRSSTRPSPTLWRW